MLASKIVLCRLFKLWDDRALSISVDYVFCPEYFKKYSECYNILLINT
jgi:hypothetical protein